MDGVVRQKRARDQEEGDVLEDSPITKKLFEGSANSGFFGLVEDGLLYDSASDVRGLSATECLVAEVSEPEPENEESASAETRVAMEETLRSLEEELVSECSTGFFVPASNGEELSSGALASWGEEVWDVHGFSNEAEESLAGNAGCSSEGSPTVSGSFSSGNSVLVDGDACETTARYANSKSHERFSAVDIGFLLEASDDELGIPPSPSSERGNSSEHDHVYQDDFLQVGLVDALPEAVSWALEGGGDNMGHNDSGFDGWMMGNLDFMMDASAGYSAMSPLVEAALVL